MEIVGAAFASIVTRHRARKWRPKKLCAE